MKPQWVENYDTLENIFLDIMIENIEYMTEVDAEIFLSETNFKDLEKNISIDEIFCKYNELKDILNDNGIDCLSTLMTKEEIISMVYELVKDKLIDKAITLARINGLLVKYN